MKISIELFSCELILKLCKNINDKYQNKQSATPFAEEAMHEIYNTRRMASSKTTINERTAYNHFINYFGCKAPLTDITPEVIKGFEAYLSDKKVTPNTSASYMRSLRAIINRMGGNGHDLFKEVSTGNKRAMKKTVSEETIKKIEKLEMPKHSKDARARDLFLLSFYANGMPLVDMVGLTTANIKENHIIYHRHKTGEEVSVLITPKIQSILKRYHQKENPFLMPFLNNEKAVKSYRQYQSILGRTNRWLYGLSKRNSLPKITSYTPRHSWATIAYKNGIDIHIIAKALGHTNPLTTLNYIKEIDYSEVDSASLLIAQSIIKCKNAA